jgi:hypothetical protein
MNCFPSLNENELQLLLRSIRKKGDSLLTPDHTISASFADDAAPKYTHDLTQNMED